MLRQGHRRAHGGGGAAMSLFPFSGDLECAPMTEQALPLPSFFFSTFSPLQNHAAAVPRKPSSKSLDMCTIL